MWWRNYTDEGRAGQTQEETRTKGQGRTQTLQVGFISFQQIYSIPPLKHENITLSGKIKKQLFSIFFIIPGPICGYVRDTMKIKYYLPALEFVVL